LIPALLRNFWPFGGAARESRVACRVLFVCTANLCRSPSAEAVFRHKVKTAGLGELVACASAGTHRVGLGSLPDARARATAQRRGYDMSRQRWRLIDKADFDRFDLIVAMDRHNLEALREICPPENAERLRLLMEFARSHEGLEIPDPYYGNAKGFELVLDMIEDACESLLEHVRSRHFGAGRAPGANAAPRS
jgi:protein-tyrosine phosphatase